MLLYTPYFTQPSRRRDYLLPIKSSIKAIRFVIVTIRKNHNPKIQMFINVARPYDKPRTSPAIWCQMWEIISDDNFGLNLDPSHLILQMIDYERVIKEFSDKLFHVRAKDLHIDRDGLYNMAF